MSLQTLPTRYLNISQPVTFPGYAKHSRRSLTDSTVYIPSLVEIGSGVQNLLRCDSHTETQTAGRFHKPKFVSKGN
jgi:hypothetical protein